MSHTPGPWAVHLTGYTGRASAKFVINDVKRRAVAHIKHSTVSPMEENAKLIAAAPDLYEALYRLLCNCPTGPEYEDEGLYQAAMERAREALLKVGAA